jgi:hypothetical protein
MSMATIKDINLLAVDLAASQTGLTIKIATHTSGQYYSGIRLGDINGDGLKDMILGYPRYNTVNSVAYVIYGKDQNFISNPDLTDLTTLYNSYGYKYKGKDLSESSYQAGGVEFGASLGKFLDINI